MDVVNHTFNPATPRYHKFGGSERLGNTESFVAIDNNYIGNTYTWQSAAATPWICSTDAGDDQTIIVQGLDANYEPIQEEVTLTGTTPKQLTKSYLRMHRGWNSDDNNFSGWVSVATANNFSVGVPQSSSQIFIVMPPDHQQTMTLHYTVPAGRSLHITSWSMGVAKGDDITAYGKLRQFGGVFRTQAVISTFQELSVLEFPHSIVMPEKSDLMVTATSTGANVDAYGQFDGVLL